LHRGHAIVQVAMGWQPVGLSLIAPVLTRPASGQTHCVVESRPGSCRHYFGLLPIS
jgi:hypothetical protein